MKYTKKDLKRLLKKLAKMRKKELASDEGDARILRKRWGTGKRERSHKKRVGDIINKTNTYDKIMDKQG